jgi:hypothetical protein
LWFWDRRIYFLCPNIVGFYIPFETIKPSRFEL